MKTTILSNYNKLIAIALTILGFGSACSPFGLEYGTGPEEYGTPTALFKVMGKVTTKDNLGIENIQVIMNYDTAYTDQNGMYEVESFDFPNNQDYLLETNDIDSTINKLYEPKDSVVSFVNPQFTGGDGKWYQGETSKEINITLTEKE